MDDLMLIVPVIGIHLLLVIIVFFDMYKNKDKRKAKGLWILMVLLIQIVGPIIYFVFGRSENKEENNIG